MSQFTVDKKNVYTGPGMPWVSIREGGSIFANIQRPGHLDTDPDFYMDAQGVSSPGRMSVDDVRTLRDALSVLLGDLDEMPAPEPEAPKVGELWLDDEGDTFQVLGMSADSEEVHGVFRSGGVVFAHTVSRYALETRTTRPADWPVVTEAGA